MLELQNPGSSSLPGINQGHKTLLKSIQIVKYMYSMFIIPMFLRETKILCVVVCRV